MTKHTAPEVAAALRANLLDALKDKPRATLALAMQLGVERQVVYRALVGLEQAGKVKSFADRRRTADAPSLVWMLPDAKPEAEDAPRRDPLVAALFGDAP